MRKRGLVNHMRRGRIAVIFLSLLLCYGLVSFSPRADSQLKLFSIDLGGVTGGANNMVLAFGRYVLIAPFAPSTGVLKDGDLDIQQLDNNLIYLIDTKKPNSPAIAKALQYWDPTSASFKSIYYPSRVAFDSQSNNVYVRGTRFEEEDGNIKAIDVIAYVRLSEDDTGKPVFDNSVISFEIPGVTSKNTSDAPLDFAFSSSGNVLVFTNGASVFSFNLTEGFLQEIKIVDPGEYSADDGISFLGLDPATNIVSVGWTRKATSGVATNLSDVFFYRLNEFGSFHLVKHLSAGAFDFGESIAAGSNVAIMSDPAKDGSEVALLITNHGSLCAVDLGADGDAGTIRRLYTYQELAENEGNSSPLNISYDSVQRVIGVVKSGFTIQISRPVNGKRGRISRPVNVHITSGTPVLAMAKLNRKNKLAAATSFSGDFAEEGGLSNFVNGQGAQWLLSTYSGKLYSVNLAEDLQQSTLTLLGNIGSNVDRIEYYSDRSSIVAINSFTPDEGGTQMASRGSLVVARMIQPNLALVQSLLPATTGLIRPGASIRRPCNIRR